MSLLLILAGVILTFAGSSWFTGAATVGVILIGAGVVWFIVALIAAAAAAKGVKNMHDSFFDRHGF